MRRLFARTAAAVTFGGIVGLVAASCYTYHCDHVIRECRVVCGFCGFFWGCCYNQCWDVCVDDHHYTQPEPPPAPPPTPPPNAPEPSPPTSPGGSGVLCSPCMSNADCQAGAVCVVPGGDAGMQASFCGHPCASEADCPAQFTCTQLGSTKQCLPAAGVCR